jgi:hypothetical protein
MSVSESEACKLLAVLCAAFPRMEIDPLGATAKLYVSYLRELETDEATATVAELIATARFFPTIAEIRGCYAERSCAEMVSPELAWGMVLAEVRRVGHVGAFYFENPALSQAVRAIGWRHICTTGNEAATRARFCDAYGSLRGKAVKARQLGRHATHALQGEAQALLKGMSNKLGPSKR